MKSKTMDKSNETTLKLTVSAIMVALSTVLSFVKFSELPYGGSVTLFSFVPILFVGYAYGAKWGLGAGLVHGILQMIFGISGATAGAGFKWWQVVLCALLDYLVAFSVLGLSGVFKKSIKNPHLHSAHFSPAYSSIFHTSSQATFSLAAGLNGSSQRAAECPTVQRFFRHTAETFSAQFIRLFTTQRSAFPKPFFLL